MPKYDIECKRCKKVWELESSMHDLYKNKKCPECGSNQTQILISGTSFSLKGSGWAKDGYSKE